MGAHPLVIRNQFRIVRAPRAPSNRRLFPQRRQQLIQEFFIHAQLVGQLVGHDDERAIKGSVGGGDTSGPRTSSSPDCSTAKAARNALPQSVFESVAGGKSSIAMPCRTSTRRPAAKSLLAMRWY